MVKLERIVRGEYSVTEMAEAVVCCRAIVRAYTSLSYHRYPLNQQLLPSPEEIADRVTRRLLGVTGCAAPKELKRVWEDHQIRDKPPEVRCAIWRSILTSFTLEEIYGHYVLDHVLLLDTLNQIQELINESSELTLKSDGVQNCIVRNGDAFRPERSIILAPEILSAGLLHCATVSDALRSLMDRCCSEVDRTIRIPLIIAAVAIERALTESKKVQPGRLKERHNYPNLKTDVVSPLQ